jgi:hypothetical protein
MGNGSQAEFNWCNYPKLLQFILQKNVIIIIKLIDSKLLTNVAVYVQNYAKIFF